MRFQSLKSRRLPAAILLAGLVAGLAGLPGCSGSSAPSGKPIVMCTIFAYYDAARAIAGDAADVRIILPKNTSPHEYQARAQDKLDAARASLLINNGGGLDDSFAKLIDNSKKTTVLTIGSVIPKSELLEGGGHDDHAGHDHAGHDHAEPFNPHYWLDPMLQIAAAEKIRDALSTQDPAHKELYHTNAAAYIEKIRKLDADFKAAAATFKTKKFIGFHSAYDYLARRYGLEQIASIEDLSGSGLTGDKLRELATLIRQNNIRYIAVETALGSTAVDKIKQEAGVEAVVLQPLETYESLDDTYDSLMRQNLEALKKILGT